MKNAVIAALVASVVASGSALAAASLINGHSIVDGTIPVTKLTGAAVASLRGVREIRLVGGPAVTVAAGAAQSANVRCPSGAFAVAGGFTVTAGGPVFVQQDGPGNGASKSLTWNVSIVNPSSGTAATFHPWATCATS